MIQLFRKPYIWIAAGAAIVAMTAVSVAENIVPRPKTYTYHPSRGSVGSTMKGHGRTLTIGTATDFPCLANDGATAADLIPWETLVTMHCATAGWLCFSMSPNSDDITIAADGTITDTNGDDGAGPCFYCSGYYAEVLSRAVFYNPTPTSDAVLARTSRCTAGTAEVGAPCRVAADCGTAGTCTAATSNSQITGAYLCGATGVLTAAMQE